MKSRSELIAAADRALKDLNVENNFELTPEQVARFLEKCPKLNWFERTLDTFGLLETWWRFRGR